MPDDPKKKDEKKGIFTRIKNWFKDAAKWIETHFDSALGHEMRADLGLKPGAEIKSSDLAGMQAHLGAIDPDSEQFSAFAAEVVTVATDIKTLAGQMKSPSQDAANVAYMFMQLSSAESMRVRLPFFYAISKLLLFVGEDIESMESLDPGRLIKGIQGKDLPSFEAWAQRWSAMAVAIVQVLDHFFGDKLLGPDSVVAYYGWDPSPDSKTPLADIVASRALTLDIGSASGTGGRVLLTMLYVPAEHGGPGMFLSLGGDIEAEQVLGNTKYSFAVGIPGALDFYIPAGGPTPFTANGDFNAFLRLDVAPAQDLSDELTPPDPSAATTTQEIGSPKKTRIEVQKFYTGVELNTQRAGFRAGVKDAKLIIELGEGDGFLKDVAGNSLTVTFDVGIIADTDGGFRLEGGTKARVTLPVGRSILGVVTVSQVELGLDGPSTNADVSLEVAGGFGLHIGPVSASVDRLGFRLDSKFGSGGNLGMLDLALAFKPPNGVGLRIDAGVVTGGGYLYFDPAAGEYAGALELTIEKIGVKAIGMLSTKMPDGSPGWSLLLFLYFQLPPIQLSFGFTLNGLGGMIGIQHGVNIDGLAAGMKIGAMDDLLFPKDPVADAPRILNRLRTLFPITPRALTFGPMIDLGWGTPRIVFLRLAIILHLDNVIGAGDSSVSFSSVVLLGQLRVEIGKDLGKATPVKLIVDILGFWDADQKRYGFLARLRDSKIGGVDIIGSLAVYGEYGDHSRFMLAAGGFNPHFTDVPDAIRSMDDRLGASFKISAFTVTLTGYFAITPGTIQFGVNLAAKAKLGPVSLEGELGGDALFQSKPYKHFLIDFHVSVAIKYKGHSLASVKCVGTVEGPGLWRLKGKASFSILFWDVDVPFDESWGTPPPLEGVAINVQAELRAALLEPANWSAQLPSGSNGFVTLAPDPVTKIPLAHPLGRFAFTQQVVPFGLNLERFGDGTVAGPTLFNVEHVKVNGDEVTDRSLVQQQFARAQFINESDDEVMSRPSFEPMDAGVEFAGSGFVVPTSGTSMTLQFETAYVGGDVKKFRYTTRASLLSKTIDASMASTHALSGAAARSRLRDSEKLSTDIGAKLSVTTPPLAAAQPDSMKSAGVALPGQATFAPAVAEQAIAKQSQNGKRPVLVEAYELVGAGVQ
jgi:hypothetical protein